MGRYSTGISTVGDCLRININSFKAKDYFKDGFEGKGSITWQNGASIGVTFKTSGKMRSLILAYLRTDREGNKQDITQTILVVGIRSNLGKGENLYFQCPVSFKRCKILYLGYDSLYFKCKEAYRNRIYYRTQTRSKLDRYNYRYWDLEETVTKLKERQKKKQYKGKGTRLQKRIDKLTVKRDWYERMRWTVLPKAVSKYAANMGVKDACQLF